MRLLGAGNDAIALGAGVNMGVRDPFAVLVRQIGTSRLVGFWHATRNVVVSGSNLVSWDDVRGSSGFGPTLLPNGGLGGTAPTVSGGTVNTDGAASFITHASALSAFNLANTAHTLVVWGEMPTSATFWGGHLDGIASATDYEVFQPQGSGIQYLSNGAATPVLSPKVEPAAGVQSLFIASRNTKYPWEATGVFTLRFEWVGRGMAYVSGTPEHAASTGYICLGRATTHYSAVKIRGIAFIAGAITPRDRAALEALVSDATVGDSVSLYAASDSTGLVHCIGDSLTLGAGSSLESTTTPVSATATNYPAVLQSLLNGASKVIDTLDTGIGSRQVYDYVTIQSGQASSYLSDVMSSLSAARRAAGLKEVVVFWMGTNDIALARTAAQIEADLTTAIAAIHAAGGRVAICPIIPRGSWYTTANETERLAVNTWIRANTAGADLVIDLSLVTDGAVSFLADPSGGSDTITNNTTYYYTDAIHMTNLGYSKIANYIYTALSGASLI